VYRRKSQRLRPPAPWRVEIYEYQPALIYLKTIVVDGIVATIGSTNPGNRSFALNERSIWSYTTSASSVRVYMRRLLATANIAVQKM